MMNILWVSPTPSHPQDAGNRAHIYSLGRELLAAGHAITFLLYDQEGSGSSAEAIAEMHEFWTDFIVVPHKLQQRKKTNGIYWGIDDWFNDHLASAVKYVATQRQFTTVICEYVFSSRALSYFDKNVLKILHCHDRMSDRAELMEKNGLPPDFFYTTPDQEKIALDRADLVLAIQEEEKTFFQSLTRKCVVELGHPIEENPLPSAKPQPRLLRIGYLGSGNSLNRKSFQVFVDALREHTTLGDDVQLVVAGSICNTIDDPDIKCLGFVENEADFFCQIDLFINPMIDGTGLKIKTLSALRHGIPFLATKAASAGLPTNIPEHNCESIDSLLNYLKDLIGAPKVKLKALRDASRVVLSAYQARIKLQLDGLLRAIATQSVKHLRRKRVLLVTDIPFWEPCAGNHSRILTLLRSLMVEFDCEVFFFGSLDRDRTTSIHAAGLSHIVLSYKDYEQSAKSLPFKSSISLIEGLKRARHDIFGKSLSLFLRQEPKYDVFIFEYLWLAYLLDAVPYQAIRILDSHDLMALREYRFSSQGLSTGISVTFKEEIAILSKFDVVIAIQQEEARRMGALLKNLLVLCCPHGVDVPEISNPQSVAKSQRLRLGFVGGGSRENAAAVQWILCEVWPVVNQMPIELHIYGRVSELLKSAPVPTGVTLHGLVPSLSTVYAGCDVMINPIMHGGGLKIKSVEALVAGKPLVSSPEGVVGISRPEASGVIVARSRKEFIDAVLILAKSPGARQKMGKEALSAAYEQFSPRVCFAPLTELLRSL